MSDPSLPLAVAGPIGLAMSAAIAALWAKIAAVERGCAEHVARLEEAADKWRERWANEVDRGAKLAAMPRAVDEPPPRELPRPEWDEDTEVRTARRAIEQRRLDEELRRYTDSTPPRPRERLKSRPG